MANEEKLTDLTPFSDALRDLLNLSTAFEVFTKIRPIIERVAAAEAGIPQAKVTLDRLTGAIATAQGELDTLRVVVEKERQQYAEATAALTQRHAEQVEKIKTATQIAIRQTRDAHAQQERELDAALEAKREAHDAALAQMKATEREYRLTIQSLKEQVATAQQHVDSIRAMVGRG